MSNRSILMALSPLFPREWHLGLPTVAFLLAAVLLFSSGLGSLRAQSDTILLPEIALTAPRLVVESRRIAQAVTVLGEDILVKGQARISLQDYAAYVPGVFAQNAENYAQDLRLSIRGFGSRSAFGIRGIRILVDGIPETTPDGQANVDNIDPAFVQSMEVIRGVATVLYGNAAGGVLALHSRNPDKLFAGDIGLLTSSNGLRKVDFWVGGRRPRGAISLFGSHLLHRGFRRWSETQSSLLNGKYELFLPRGKLRILINGAYSPQANDPGALQLAEVGKDRQAAAARNVQFLAGEELSQVRVGTTWDQEVGEQLRLQAYAFYARRDFDNRLPFEAGGWVTFLRHFAGGGLSLQRRGDRWQWLLGLEHGDQADLRKRYANRNGIRGSLGLDQTEKFRGTGLYGQLRRKLTPSWEAILGSRLDRMGLSVQDGYRSDGDDGGQQSFLRWNPSLGLWFQAGKGAVFFGDWSRHFETPALTELSANPTGQGGFNPGLRPQSSAQLSFGYRMDRPRLWRTEISLYRIAMRDEWIAYGLPAFPGRTFYRNAGRSQRHGLEWSGHFLPERSVNLFLSCTWSRHLFREYRLGNQDLTGNRVPGSVPFQGFGELRMQLHPALYTAIQLMLTAEQYANDDNSVAAPSYTLLGMRMQYRPAPFWEWTAGAGNILGAAYYGNIRVNAAAGRFFEPAAGRTFYLAWRFFLAGSGRS